MGTFCVATRALENLERIVAGNYPHSTKGVWINYDLRLGEKIPYWRQEAFQPAELIKIEKKK